MKVFNANVQIHIDEVPNDILFDECALRISAIIKNANKKKQS